jgi:hypothetical protein
MRRKHTNTGSAKATRASVSREMAKPRMSRSAKIAALNLDRKHVRLPPSVSLPGTVDRIIPAKRSNKSEKAQIGVDGADQLYRKLRIDNALVDEHGDDVKLKRGAHVEVTVTAEAKSSTGVKDEDS